MSPAHTTLMVGVRLYLSRQATSLPRYFAEQAICALFGWIPSIVGIAARAIAYRAILKMRGVAAIESKVRMRFCNNIELGRGVYIDEHVYLHACPNGIQIGDGTFVMHGSVLHVYNFRDLKQSGIRIGCNSLIGEYNILRGQGGIHIGNRVYTSPFVQLLAVNHVFEDRTRPFVEQGITAKGIHIEDDVWLGAGAIITDGVKVGKGAVVAAGAVVTRDVPAYCVVAGIPARVIKEIGATAAYSNSGSIGLGKGVSHE